MWRVNLSLMTSSGISQVSVNYYSPPPQPRSQRGRKGTWLVLLQYRPPIPPSNTALQYRPGPPFTPPPPMSPRVVVLGEGGSTVPQRACNRQAIEPVVKYPGYITVGLILSLYSLFLCEMLLNVHINI